MTKTVIAGSNDNHCLNQALYNPGAEINFAECLPLYGVILLMQETSKEELDDLSSELPTDTHLCIYKYPDGSVGCDAVRSHSKADIFDAYHDSGLKVIEIASGHGSIKPKLFQDAKSTSAKKKS